jgi:ABC-2 type transport system ATP-binding protein
MTHAIQTRSLRYKASAHFDIRDLSLTVPAGAVYGFLGPNGSGKTTTIRLLLGLLRPTGGDIEVLGQRMPTETPSVLARVGYVPERPHLYPSLTVAEAMRFHAAFHKRWDAKWASDLAGTFMLRSDSRIATLSKGEMGKLMMLLALAQRPELLVLDEPTDGLDPVVRRDMLESVLGYVAEQGATVFISSHLVHELERICDWVGVMDRGRLVAELPMQRFKSGIKRLYVSGTIDELASAPFVVLKREREVGSALEEWIVRGWESGMQSHIESRGAAVREVIDLDLEDGFVEMLRAARTVTPTEA